MYKSEDQINLYVINLDERKDRWDNIVKTFTDPYFNIIRVKAIKDRKGWAGCFLSHIECIRIGKDAGLKNILVLEDDCIPYDSIEIFLNRLKTIKEFLDKINDWDIYLGGTVHILPNSYKNIISYKTEKFVEFNKAYTTHLICYNSKVYEYFLSLKPILPIDEIWHGKIKAIVSVPFLAKQIPGYSDIVGKQKSDDIRIEQANKILLDYLSK
jgi:GR25 family glycosyltransferase involved in LPS biosynthesis